MVGQQASFYIRRPFVGCFRAITERVAARRVQLGDKTALIVLEAGGMVWLELGVCSPHWRLRLVVYLLGRAPASNNAPDVLIL